VKLIWTPPKPQNPKKNHKNPQKKRKNQKVPKKKKRLFVLSFFLACPEMPLENPVYLQRCPRDRKKLNMELSTTERLWVSSE
jgi:hypothetical protein